MMKLKEAMKDEGTKERFQAAVGQREGGNAPIVDFFIDLVWDPILPSNWIKILLILTVAALYLWRM